MSDCESCFNFCPINLLYLFLFVFWMVYLYFVKDYGYWEQRKVTHIPAVFPLGSLTRVVIGHNHDKTMLDTLYTDYKDHRFIGFISIREPRLMIRDPKLIKSILHDNYDHFSSRGWVKINPNDYLLANAMSKSTSVRREIRKKVAPAYIADNYGGLFSSVWQSSIILKQTVEKQIEDQNCIDTKNVLTQFTMKLFDTIAFGTDINSQSDEDETFYRVCRETLNGGFKVKLKFFVYEAFPLVTKIHLFDMFDPGIVEATKRKVMSSVKNAEDCKTKSSSVLNILLKIRRDELTLRDLPKTSKTTGKVGLTMEEIIGESFTFFIFSQEKSARVAQFCLYEIACNANIQEKVFQEVQTIFKEYNDDSKCSTVLDGMTYLDKVVNETLRRYPIMSTLYRQCTHTFKVPNSDLVIEKGLRLMIPLYSVHHDSKYFPEPYTFNPDRFSAENCQKRHPCVFMPYGFGPRKCTGYRFGLMTVKMAVARLVHNFHIGLTPDTPVPLQFTNDSYLTKPLKPIKLIFTKR